jgi:hypothetical protein
MESPYSRYKAHEGARSAQTNVFNSTNTTSNVDSVLTLPLIMMIYNTAPNNNAFILYFYINIGSNCTLSDSNTFSIKASINNIVPRIASNMYILKLC